MFNKESDVRDWIDGFGYSSGLRTLDHLRIVLAELGNPHDKLKTIHVAGTNGKGSTVAFLHHVLVCSGLQVGTFTSPHMISFGERMSINGEPLTRVSLIKYANQIAQILGDKKDDHFSSFDVITLISFLHFAQHEVDVVIYETGMGGRLDATNVITPLVCGITNVGHDHAEILGETQLARALEKLGIVKEGIPLFTTEEDPELLAQFKQTCTEKNATLNLPLHDAEFIRTVSAGTLFHFRDYRFVKLSMHGQHQFKNATLALAMIDYLINQGLFEIDIEAIYKGLDLTSWPGRFEHIQKDPLVILDGAHNIEGIKSLIGVLNDVYPKHRKRFIFSAMPTKDAATMIEMLSEIAVEIIFTKGTHPAAVAPEELYDMADFPGKKVYVFQSFKKVITQVIKNLNPNEMLVICGSLYFISDARMHLTKLKRESVNDEADRNCN